MICYLNCIDVSLKIRCNSSTIHVYDDNSINSLDQILSNQTQIMNLPKTISHNQMTPMALSSDNAQVEVRCFFIGNLIYGVPEKGGG